MMIPMKGPPPHNLKRGNSLMEATSLKKENQIIRFFMRSIPLVTLAQGVAPPVRVEAEAQTTITEVHQKTTQRVAGARETTFPKEGGNSSYYIDSFKWGFFPSLPFLLHPQWRFFFLQRRTFKTWIWFCQTLGQWK